MVPYVTLEGIGEGPLTLHYDANAVEWLQAEAGTNDLSALMQRAATMDMKVAKLMFAAALRRNHASLTLEQVGRFMDGQHLGTILDHVAKAWARFMGVDEVTGPQTGSASPSSSTGAA